MEPSASLASANPLVERCRGYFERFLPGLLGQLLIEDLSNLNATFAIAVSDTPDPAWRLEVKDGRLVHVGHEGEAPVCTFTLNGQTMLEVVSGRLAPAEGFFAMRIELDGDLEMGLRLSTVLEPFFLRFPYTAS